MKTKTLLVRTAAVSALFALQACSMGDQASLADHDPYELYKYGNVYQCDQIAQPDMRTNSQQTPTPGFGCAHRSNFTAMVANPEDLEQARAMTPADAAARDRVFQAYREGKDTSVAKRAQGTQGLIE